MKLLDILPSTVDIKRDDLEDDISSVILNRTSKDKVPKLKKGVYGTGGSSETSGGDGGGE